MPAGSPQDRPADEPWPALGAASAAGDFRPTASWERLRGRARLLMRMRAFFDRRGFTEVETPLLSHDVVVDLHLDPLRLTLPEDARRPDIGQTLWLQTSPEFGMKRLLAAGAGPIYQITRAVRGGETGRLHNPEFTLVEWYRAGEGYREGMHRLAELATEFFAAPAVAYTTYAEAFIRHLQVDPHSASAGELARCAQVRGLVPPASLGEERDGWLNYLLAECVEPQLGIAQPTILYDYPASQAALARVRSGTPAVAERFELYVRGVELANGYHELTDPAELRRRMTEANRQRLALGKPVLPEGSRLLAAMEHGLPDSVGVALGFDRLAMLAMGADSIAEVLAFPIDRA